MSSQRSIMIKSLRLAVVIDELRRGKTFTTHAYMERFRCARRTAERDLVLLSTALPVSTRRNIRHSSAEPKNLWYWDEGV